MQSIVSFLQLQVDRIVKKAPVHASGPKKPSLSQQDLGKTK